MTRKKVVIALIVIVVLGGMVYANFAFKRTPGLEVNVEKIELRDLEADLVVAAGTRIRHHVELPGRRGRHAPTLPRRRRGGQARQRGPASA